MFIFCAQSILEDALSVNRMHFHMASCKYLVQRYKLAVRTIRWLERIFKDCVSISPDLVRETFRLFSKYNDVTDDVRLRDTLFGV